jgi:uncharacterized protein YkwD
MRSVRFSVALMLIGCVTQPAPTPAMIPPRTPPQAEVDRDFARVESEILAALNRARTDPRGTADALAALAPYYSGTLFQRPTQPVPIRTTEGVAALREAVTAVRGERPLAPLVLSPELSRAARDHAADQQRTGNIGHSGSDGSTVDVRVSRYGSWRTSLSENIDYSPAKFGVDVVQNLLIDDGVPDRGHRRNIYSASSRLVGIACGPHPRYAAMCVIVQAAGFTPR